MRSRVLWLLAGLITYGSLFPFHFVAPGSPGAAFEKLLLDWTLFTSWGDALGNLGLFVPFGFAGVFTVPGQARAPHRVSTILLASFLLALVLQVLQIYFPPRRPAMADVVWNMLGASVGILAGWFLRGRIQVRGRAWQNAHAMPVALIALWLAAELLPLVPSLDLQSIKNSVKALLRLDLSPVNILWHAAGVLVAGSALKAIVGAERTMRLLAVLVAIVLAGKVLVATRVLNASTLVGCAAGYAAWIWGWGARRPLRGESLIPLIVLAAYTLKALEPFEVRWTPADFSWVPFGAMLQGEMLINAMVLVTSVFAYAAILGFVHMRKGAVGAVSVVLALWVGALEAIQMYIVGRTADITEPLLVLLVGLMLRYVPDGAKHEPRPRAAPRREPQSRTASASHTPHLPSLYVPGLDGLRAVACLMVFAVHFGQTTHLQGTAGPFDLERLIENGNSGVALFFALSGFLLGLPYWHAMRSGARFPPVGEYLIRRAGRILPAYFVCLTFLVVINRYWLKSDWPYAVLLHYALVFNYSEATLFRINPPFWTLAVEFQFYLLLPLIFLLARRMSAGKAMALVIALGFAAYLAHFAVMSAAASTLGPAGKPSNVLTYSLLAHLPHFLMGVATGWIFVFRGLQERIAHGRSSPGIEAALWASVALVLLILGTAVDEALRIPYGRYNLPYLPALLCAIIVLTPLSTSGKRLLESLPLRALGVVSYGVYIYHLPIQNAVARNMPSLSLAPRENWLVFGVVSLGLTLAVAAASYWALERPILNALKRRAPSHPAHTSRAPHGAGR